MQLALPPGVRFVLANVVLPAVVLAAGMALAESVLPALAGAAAPALGTRSAYAFGEFMPRHRRKVALSAAHSLAVVLCVWPALCGFALDAAAVQPLAATWASLMLSFQVAAFWLGGHEQDWERMTLFLVMVCAVFVEQTVFELFLAVLAAGTAARALDFAHYGAQHLFPLPGTTPAWGAVALWSARLDRYHKAALRAEAWALLVLFVHVAWTEQMDYITLTLSCCLAVMTSLKDREFWVRAAPPVLREEGRLLSDVFSQPMPPLEDIAPPIAPPKDIAPPVAPLEDAAKEEAPTGGPGAAAAPATPLSPAAAE